MWREGLIVRGTVLFRVRKLRDRRRGMDASLWSRRYELNVLLPNPFGCASDATTPRCCRLNSSLSLRTLNR